MTYIPISPNERDAMLKTIGVKSLDDLFESIPAKHRFPELDLPPALTEMEAAAELQELADANESARDLICFLGAGCYNHYIPAVIDHMLRRGEFYTAYTPYQPELSQGTLQAIYEYQSDICRLTSLEVSNASLYDGGTALYEACQMAIRATERPRVLVDGGVNPIYRKMLYSYTANLSIEFQEIPVSHGQSDREKIYASLNPQTAALILQNPNFFGVIDNHRDIVEKCHSLGILVIQSVYPIALALLAPPGEIGVDIATGEGQSLGIPLSFGGPYLGFLAARKSLIRKMPGRIVGRTTDAQGREGFVLTLQAREQHIRREKATSNICSNEALCALRAHAYLSLLGKAGLADVARLCYSKAQYAKERLKAIPEVSVMETSPTFNEFTVRLPMDAAEAAGKLIDRGFAPGFPLGIYYPGMENYLLVAVTEKRTKFDIGSFVETLESVVKAALSR
jgi:glycine dehydrogenase subunit 1